MYINARFMCIILVANIIWRSASHYIRPLFYISPFSTIIAYASSQFSTSQLYNMILAARLVATLFGRQIVLPMDQKIGQGELAKRYG